MRLGEHGSERGAGVACVRMRGRWPLLALVVVLGGAVSVTPALATVSPTVLAVGGAPLASPAPGYPGVVGIALEPGGGGYDVVRIDGRVDAYGDAEHGTPAPHGEPGVSATGIAIDAATGGYWVLFSNGHVEAVGAPALGGPRIPAGGWGQYPAAVAIAATSSGRGYVVLRANGAVDAFGATARGSLAPWLSYGTTAPVTATAIAIDPATGGYWIATSAGTVNGFDAPVGGALDSRAAISSSPTVALAPWGQGVVALRANGALDASGTTVPAASVAVPPGSQPVGLASSARGLDVALDASAWEGYVNPLRVVRALVPQEVDQGVDYCGSGPVYAMGPGVVLTVSDPGWPSGTFISYRLSAGPAAGHVVYVAENVTPRVRIGAHVTAASVLGVVHDAKTCLETGWASPTRRGWAAGAAQFTGRNSTAYGQNFSALLETLGARPGLTLAGPSGSLPPDWPRWPARG